MLATLLLLAQLVLPWPGLDSPLVQPGPTICVGACAGPVIYGAAERGRLVVACDMRSSTCSDGRQITTVRASPVPCEVSPGVWEMVGPNEGCYGVRGLESWASTTSYLAYGAELDREPWTVDAHASIASLPGGGYRVCHIDPDAGNHGLRQLLGGARPETLTVAAIARANTAPSALIGAWSQFETLALPVSWDLVAATKQTASGASGQIFFYPRPAGQDQCIDLLATWLTHTSTPGRPCWGGEAPVTCAQDGHTISTDGWPTESGEIAVSFEVGALEGSARYIIDGRATGATTHSILLIESTGLLRLDLVAGTPNRGPLVPPGKHHIRIRVSDGRTKIRLNGMEVIDAEGTPTWHTEAVLGSRYTDVDPLHGSIRSLTVRSYEEVAP